VPVSVSAVWDSLRRCGYSHQLEQWNGDQTQTEGAVMGIARPFLDSALEAG
jgi:hypothetical protein